MPDSQASDKRTGLYRDIEGVSWNDKALWQVIIGKIDEHCEKICRGCFQYKDCCACGDEQ